MKSWAGTAALISVMMLTSVSGQQSDRRPDHRGWDRDWDRDAAFARGEVLMRFRRALNTAQRNGVLSNLRAKRLRRFDALDIDLVRVPPGLAFAASLGRLRAIPGVVFAQPNYFRAAIQSAPPNDPFWLEGKLWGLDRIQAQPVWTGFTRGDSSVVVASIDSGVNYTHPDLAPNIWLNRLEIPGNGIDDDGNGYVDDIHGIDTVDRDSDPADVHGHGTLTAGVVAAVGNNGVGGAGVAWNAKILPCRFLDDEGVGTDAGAIECLDYIVQLKARGENIRASSNGWGATRSRGTAAPALQAAFEAAGAAGIINIAGSGNDGRNNDATPFDPASLSTPSIVSVASSDGRDGRSPFSNYGATTVDLAAPGEKIMSPSLEGGYATFSGTSAAAAHAAGVAVLLSSLDPTLSVAGVKSFMLDNVDRLPAWAGRVRSGGRLNAFRAASAAGGPNNPPSVSILNPVAGAVYQTPVALLIEADATDSNGSVQRVEFFVNGVSMGIDTTAPFAAAWNSTSVGTHVLSAVATDNMDASATSASVSIQVRAPNTPPTVTLTSPTHGSSVVAPATISLVADASDADGTIASVTFFVDGVPIGTDTVSPFSMTWAADAAGSFTFSASATDNLGATTLSFGALVTVSVVLPRINVALAANGGVASASSTLTSFHAPAGAINGDRRGVGWGTNGGWNDATMNATPDWLEVVFNGPKAIDEVSVFSMQDNFTAPVDPTATQTFTTWGLRGFEIQYWTGSAWASVPGTTVSTNNLVWRRFTITPLTTTRIRVFITAPLNGYSRVIEVEAWGVAANPPIVASLRPDAGPLARWRSMLR